MSCMVHRTGTRSRQPLRITAAVPPRNPPYQTKPPRENSAPGSRVSATYQSLAPMMPPITAAATMSAE